LLRRRRLLICLIINGVLAKSKLQFLYKLHEETMTIDNTSYNRRYCTFIKTVKGDFICNTTENSSNISKSVWKIVNEDRYTGEKKHWQKYFTIV
jgi:hypothetical protein